MSEVMKLQKKVQDLTALLSSKDDFIKELRVKDSLLRKHQERVQRLREECEACGRDLKRCKDENYDLALRLARQSEEKGAALMRNRDLQLEVPCVPGAGGAARGGARWPRGGPQADGGALQIDRLKHSLMKAEDDCKVERKHTLKLRHAMEQRPSQELLWELQQEKALLQARVQELEAATQVAAGGAAGGRPGHGPPPAGPCPARLSPAPPQEGKLDRSSPYIQVLEEDWRQALRDHQQQANTIFALRKDLRQAEALRARVRSGAGGPGAAAQPGGGAAQLCSTSLPRPCWRRGARTAHPLPARSPCPRMGRPDRWSGRPVLAGPEGPAQPPGRGRRRWGQLPPPAVHGGEGDVRAAVPGPAEGLQDVQGPHRGHPAADGGGRHRAGPGRCLPPSHRQGTRQAAGTAKVGPLRRETVPTSRHPRGLQPARGWGRSAKRALKTNGSEGGTASLPPCRREAHVPFCRTSQTLSTHAQFCFCSVKMEAVLFCK